MKKLGEHIEARINSLGYAFGLGVVIILFACIASVLIVGTVKLVMYIWNGVL